jgi:general L-amino acid transport system permease protein
MTTTFPPSSNLPPAVAQLGAIAWARKNLFSNWFSSLLTILIGFVLFQTVTSLVQWATTTAQWEVIPANLPLFFVGRFPGDQRWRIWVIVGLIALLSGLSWGILGRNLAKLFSRNSLIGIGIAALIAVFLAGLLAGRRASLEPQIAATISPLTVVIPLAVVGLVVASAWVGRKLGRQVPALGQWISLAWFLSFPIVLWLLLGGFGLRSVSTNDWGGLMLTVFLAVVSIVVCFPLGVLLALGRQSTLPAVRWLSTLYIEIIRGVPLIAILFMGQVMIPLFLPEGARPDRILRAIVGLTLFSAAYLAENVRGGLQSVPRGQTEAANALGLSTPLTTALIILPQALKVSIPAIVGQFISLFQDTTLLSIVGLLELLGISRAVLSNPQFLGRYAEVYLFIGVMYWIFCYAMSLGSRRLEESLNAGQR